MIASMFFQDGLTDSAWSDWANHTDSPLRLSMGNLECSLQLASGIQLATQGMVMLRPSNAAVKQNSSMAVCQCMQPSATLFQNTSSGLATFHRRQVCSLRISPMGWPQSLKLLHMIVIIGIFFQAGLTNSAWGDWAFHEVGYIVPEYFRWPGYIAPSRELANGRFATTAPSTSNSTLEKSRKRRKKAQCLVAPVTGPVVNHASTSRSH